MDTAGTILTVDEVSQMFKVSSYTVRRWCSEGRIPAFKIGREWRIDLQDLKRFINKQKKKAEWRKRT